MPVIALSPNQQHAVALIQRLCWSPEQSEICKGLVFNVQSKVWGRVHRALLLLHVDFEYSSEKGNAVIVTIVDKQSIKNLADYGVAAASQALKFQDQAFVSNINVGLILSKPEKDALAKLRMIHWEKLHDGSLRALSQTFTQQQPSSWLTVLDPLVQQFGAVDGMKTHADFSDPDRPRLLPELLPYLKILGFEPNVQKVQHALPATPAATTPSIRVAAGNLLNYPWQRATAPGYAYELPPLSTPDVVKEILQYLHALGATVNLDQSRGVDVGSYKVGREYIIRLPEKDEALLKARGFDPCPAAGVARS